MTLQDRKIEIVTGVNDIPSTTGGANHPNASLLCKQYNDLIDDLTALSLGEVSSQSLQFKVTDITSESASFTFTVIKEASETWDSISFLGNYQSIVLDTNIDIQGVTFTISENLDNENALDISVSYYQESFGTLGIFPVYIYTTNFREQVFLLINTSSNIAPPLKIKYYKVIYLEVSPVTVTFEGQYMPFFIYTSAGGNSYAEGNPITASYTNATFAYTIDGNNDVVLTITHTLSTSEPFQLFIEFNDNTAQGTGTIALLDFKVGGLGGTLHPQLGAAL